MKIKYYQTSVNNKQQYLHTIFIVYFSNGSKSFFNSMKYEFFEIFYELLDFLKR